MFQGNTYQFFSFEKKHRVHHRVTNAYHPQAIGHIKVANGEIKNIMKKIIRPYGKEWLS